MLGAASCAALTCGEVRFLVSIKRMNLKQHHLRTQGLQHPVGHIIVALLAFLSACQSPSERYFRYASPEVDAIVELPAQGIQLLRANLYRVGDGLALGVTYREAAAAPDKDAVRMDSLGTLLFDLATYRLSVDTASYHWVVPDLIAADGKRVYAFPRKYHLPIVKLLHMDPATLVRCDTDATYLKDADTVYCIPVDSYLQVEPSAFTTMVVGGVTYGRDTATYYHWDEVVERPGGGE